MKVKELVEQAFLEGYRAGLGAFAHWKDGRQLVGTCGRYLADAIKEAPEAAKPHFDLFMERCQANWTPAPTVELPRAIGGTSDGAN